MTPDQQERLAIVETKVDHTEAAVKRIEDKLDALVAQSNMGKGALWLFMSASAVFGSVLTWLSGLTGIPKP